MNIGNFLNDREKRVEYQKKLIEKYKKTLVVLKANFPGKNKNLPLADNIVDAISEEIDKLFEKNIIFRENFRNEEGKFFFYILEGNAYNIKKSMIILEESHELGRCADIDVHTPEGNVLSRKDIGNSFRKCFLCNDKAYNCVRSMKHSYEELYNFLEEKYRNYIAHKFSLAALEGLIYEVSAYPSFGLVSPVNTGSHKDMNFYTFLESGFAIEKAFYEITRIGYSDIELDTAFSIAREIGKKAEISMMRATKNVNTHKGLIFLMGITVLATARNFYLGKNIEKIPELIRKITKNILDDFKNIGNKENLTNGEKLYVKYGFTGIRGEVREGLTGIFDDILPFYDENLKCYSKNTVCSMTLIKLMNIINDSTIVHRHGIEMLSEVKKRTKSLIGISEKEKLEKFEKWCIENNISPGGSADVLAVVIFLHNIYY
ncbi:citrate lyase holo-[acyl-carrier protein] synthase [Leptotrichia sp. OH3620_COT-345]|uniref:citrate lyase holo-[acyl-carrier protein] synthase n=1 Tax=Leptotrichia sp. OH3620_COT-345 TaxID=2491048 RepID=UPI000F64AB01|nr:citrate lyase holo-[acyl-carrier protein] synthase [Leptotrichia sp. OH3620_COT-345]RRD40692.1 citrate lyase holo-[acyl-carrier protein] synthase [Leptotrichia sp. OH3620_COT-345]